MSDFVYMVLLRFPLASTAFRVGGMRVPRWIQLAVTLQILEFGNITHLLDAGSSEFHGDGNRLSQTNPAGATENRDSAWGRCRSSTLAESYERPESFIFRSDLARHRRCRWKPCGDQKGPKKERSDLDSTEEATRASSAYPWEWYPRVTALF